MEIIYAISIVLFGAYVALKQWTLGHQLKYEFINEIPNPPTILFFQKNKRILSANKISIYRIIAGPICYILHSYVIIDHNIILHSIFFSLCLNIALGDYLDGQIAKNCGMTSIIGALLDPFADKVFYLLLYYAFIGNIPELHLIFYILLIPELCGTIFRKYMTNPAATMIGKIKAFVIFSSLPFFYVGEIFGLIHNYLWFYQAILIIATILAYCSAIMKINFTKIKIGAF